MFTGLRQCLLLILCRFHNIDPIGTLPIFSGIKITDWRIAFPILHLFKWASRKGKRCHMTAEEFVGWPINRTDHVAWSFSTASLAWLIAFGLGAISQLSSRFAS